MTGADQFCGRRDREEEKAGILLTGRVVVKDRVVKSSKIILPYMAGLCYNAKGNEVRSTPTPLQNRGQLAGLTTDAGGCGNGASEACHDRTLDESLAGAAAIRGG